LTRTRKSALVAAAVILLVQLVPYGRAHRNPPRIGEPPWNAPRTRQLFISACGDCHSNETRWPWYSHVAPASWLVQRDVEQGRSHFDVSEWGREGNEGDEAAEELESGEMPPWFYLPLHPEARLSEADERALLAGLRATFGEHGD
jgi:mono/diheme cytochrome c family protein